MNSTITIIVVWLGVSLLFLAILPIVYFKRRKKNTDSFHRYWPQIENAISASNFEDVCYFTNKILWNPCLSKFHFEPLISFLKTHRKDDIDSIELLKSIEDLFDKRGWNAAVR